MNEIMWRLLLLAIWLFLMVVFSIFDLSILFKKKRQTVELQPGKCECGHNRCSHKKGQFDCTVAAGSGVENIRGCACTIYIRAKNDGGDRLMETPTPSD
jgi:hypothetical protein